MIDLELQRPSPSGALRAMAQADFWVQAEERIGALWQFP